MRPRTMPAAPGITGTPILAMVPTRVVIACGLGITRSALVRIGSKTALELEDFWRRFDMPPAP